MPYPANKPEHYLQANFHSLFQKIFPEEISFEFDKYAEILQKIFSYISLTNYLKKGTRSKATMLATLIMGLMAGPAVSLYGSPTVSPVTAA